MIYNFFPKYSSNIISLSQFLSSFHLEPCIKSQLRLHLHKALSIVLLEYDKAPVLPKQGNLKSTPPFPFQWALKAPQTLEFMHTSTSKAQHLPQLLQNLMLFRAQHGDHIVFDIHSLQSNPNQTKLAFFRPQSPPGLLTCSRPAHSQRRHEFLSRSLQGTARRSGSSEACERRKLEGSFPCAYLEAVGPCTL